VTWSLPVESKANGSGISLGHLVGATGGRILATLLRETDRRGSRYGLETMCIGGGQGMSAIFERLAWLRRARRTLVGGVDLTDRPHRPFRVRFSAWEGHCT
jgi:Thiolase, C-terminal domain